LSAAHHRTGPAARRHPDRVILSILHHRGRMPAPKCCRNVKVVIVDERG